LSYVPCAATNGAARSWSRDCCRPTVDSLKRRPVCRRYRFRCHWWSKEPPWPSNRRCLTLVTCPLRPESQTHYKARRVLGGGTFGESRPTLPGAQVAVIIDFPRIFPRPRKFLLISCTSRMLPRDAKRSLASSRAMR